MKLKQFLENLDLLVALNPEYLELDVVYAIDEEGKGYNMVFNDPCVGELDDGDFFDETDNPKVICIN